MAKAQSSRKSGRKADKAAKVKRSKTSGAKAIILVADQKARAEINRPFARCLFQHAWGRLATIAGYGQRFDGAVRMVRAEIERIDMGAHCGKSVLHVRVERFYGRFVVEAARNTGLV